MSVRILGRGGGTAEPSTASREHYAESLTPSSSHRSRDPYGQETPQYRAYSGQHPSQPQSYYPPAQAPLYEPQASGQDPYRGSQMGPGVVHEQALYAEPRKRRWYMRIPFLTIAIIVACIIVFIVTMGINNCPAQPHFDGMTCVLPFLGRFSFEPTKINPMLGPSAQTLLNMGALNAYYVLQLKQSWRLLTAMWLHAGVVHIVSNMLGIYFLGAPMEREFGIPKTGIVYLLSGISGAILSSLLLKNAVSVGASGALFGLAGASVSELIMNWDHYANRVSAIISLIVLILINLALGLMPYIDNFAHIGGCIAGLLLGFALLVKPQRGYVNMKSRDNVAAAAAAAEAGGVVVSARNTTCQNVTRILALVTFLALFFTGLGLVLTGQEANCDWCSYLTCVPTSLWDCNNTSPTGGVGAPVCQTTSYMNGTGILACANSTSAVYSNFTSYSSNELRVLCTNLCS